MGTWLNSRAWHAVCCLLRLPFEHCSNMSPRPTSTAYASGAAPQEAYTPLSSPSDKLRFKDSPLSPSTSSRTAWVDPTSLSNYGDVSQISGNVTPQTKQLILNTFMAYGAGDEGCFGHAIAKSVRFVDMSVSKCEEKHGRMDATTVAEVVVTKSMLNGAGMLHGGCIAFLVDNCCSTPLVALGLLQNVNGVGVTQAMNILFHSPAPGGSCLRIISTSVAMGGRIMSARCEVIEKRTGRIVASAHLNKMQPSMAKL
ncbi:HotDog domain-containing protein [Pisolithus sp. B1]|nr:HotDog domain-containing protein [Pisolithus sp. B1]